MSKKLAIIAANGEMFDAYKVFNIAAAAAATDAEVAIFFTFEGLNLIHKDAHKQLSLPAGKEHFQEGFKAANVPAVEDLVQMVKEMGVRFIACQMTMDIMNLNQNDFVEGIEVGGAATFLEFGFDADATLTF